MNLVNHREVSAEAAHPSGWRSRWAARFLAGGVHSGAASGRLALCGLLAVLVLRGVVHADPAAFDLSGPSVEVKVTRAGKTLPIAQVANLAPGDRLWIHPVLPPSESVHYLMIAVFLRGSTNPPPENWFFKREIWTKEMSEEGTVITVPPEAEQLLLFFAPQTGGDFSSLRSAVSGKPGAFVRASQDLNQAGRDRARLEMYLSAIKRISQTEPQALHDRSLLLARSLNIKLDQECFDKPSEAQAPCLMQNTDQLVLDDGHSQSMVDALASGANTDLIGQISSTRLAGGGTYSPYVGAVVDVARIMGNLHTASYQYIPALALPQQEQMNLKLNNPPSFRKPMSVLVASLPAIGTEQPPLLRPVDPDRVYCLQKNTEALAVEGAPLVFGTELGHDFVLRVQGKAGKPVDLPVIADAAQGGFTIDLRAFHAGSLGSELRGTLRGYWGFAPFEGPSFQLRSAHPAAWAVLDKEKTALLAGHDGTVHLRGGPAICVDQVGVKDGHGDLLKATWKSTKPDELEVTVPLKDAAPGPIAIGVKQFGVTKADEVPLQAYAEPSHIDRFTIRAGESAGLLKGTHLDEVSAVELKGIRFLLAGLTRPEDKDELQLSASAAPNALQPAEALVAHVTLKDGRVLDVPATVEPPRPKVAMVSKTVQAGPAPVRLANPDDLPQDNQLSFVVRTEIPETFSPGETIEVAGEDESFHALLSFTDGSLVLQDAHTALAVLNPLKSFGPSAFGPLRFRVGDATGAKGDWLPLARLVRVPALKEVRCPGGPDEPCRLVGSSLFLIDAVASNSQFTHPVQVPPGFADTSLKVPRPNGTLLYLKLRDDPSAVNSVALPVLPEP
jgi:hypothetical protein